MRWPLTAACTGLAALALSAMLLLAPERSDAAGSPAAIAAGFDHTCALSEDGTVRCWGDNTSGELGDGTNQASAVPGAVCAGAACSAALSGVTDISAGRDHTCALLEDGAVRCWGDNTSGQLGDGTTNDRNAPVQVSGLPEDVVALSAGRYYTCAITAAARLLCWGANLYGVLGNGTNDSSVAPVAVCADAGCAAPLAGVVAVATERYHACALLDDTSVRCWGENAMGELGDGTTARSNAPVAVCADAACAAPLTGVSALSLGLRHTCVLLDDSRVQCWGANDVGQLGDGTNVASSTPVEVAGLTGGAVALSAGQDQTCVVTTGGGAECWGANTWGQLGDGSAGDSNVPVEVCADVDCTTGLAAVTAVSAGAFHTCALLAGEPGGTRRHEHGRVTPLGSEGLWNASMSAGFASEDRQAKCWGLNTSGQLGAGVACAACPAPVDVLFGEKPGPTATPAQTSVGTATLAPTVTRVPTATPTPRPLGGDVDCSGGVTSIDAALVLQYGAALLAALRCADAGDLNADGRIDAIDAALILQRVAGLIDGL